MLFGGGGDVDGIPWNSFSIVVRGLALAIPTVAETLDLVKMLALFGLSCEGLNCCVELLH